MKILHILSAPAAGGAEVYIRDLAIAMTNNGHAVHIGFVGHAEDIGRCADYESEFLRQLESENISFFFIGNECRRRPWAGMRRARKYVAVHSIEIYHSHLMFGIVFGAILRVPRIYTHHNIIPKAGKFAYFFFNRLVKQYIGISQICSKRLMQYTGRNVTTILNGADLQKFQFESAQNATPSNLVECIAVGGLTDQKNYKLLIEAFSLLSNDVKERVHLSICGEGPVENTMELLEMVQANGMSDYISFLGNRNDVPQLLDSSDLFLMSSAWEGLPIALIEASLAGLACVVTDVGGCSEVIDICHNGTVVKPGDSHAFASAIGELVRNREKRLAMKAEGRQRSTVFSIQNACNQHLQLYSRLLRKES